MNTQQHKSKSFFSAVAAHVLGLGPRVKLTGSPQQIHVTKEAVLASKSLYEGLQKENASISEIKELLVNKREKAQRFLEITGMNWIL
jgi:hypothetical protein